ncbi:MAG: divergent PAP2 family protein [Anaerolineae bacterium]|nr:divergent PAP2 family protein [Anaerolineae bacterium]
MPPLSGLFTNDLLWVPVFSSVSAQFLKPFTGWLRTRHWNWRLMAATGGMPSSHSALVSALATGMGLELGFDSPLFALCIALAMIVTYDAAGVRRHAGEHARAINLIIAELLHGHPLEKIEFKEVLGHSRAEVIGGVAFGIIIMAVWRLILVPLIWA